MSIREKLLDLKRRLQDRKMYSIVLVVIAAVSIWGISQYRNSANLRQQLDNRYSRTFYDMVGYVRNVEVLLMKSLVSSTPAKTAATLQEAWRQANLAQANLGQLPISQQVLANTSKFLTQVGDLAYSLNNQNMDGKHLNEDQYNTIQDLYGYSVSLGDSLDELQSQILTGRIKWGELSKRGEGVFQKTSENLPHQQFENIDKTFQDMPKLIYDGPFSDHLVTIKPRGITGNDLNAEEAKQKVIDFLGADRVQAVELHNQNDTEPIRTFSYKVTFKNVPEEQTAIMSVTQKGGHPFWLIYDRPVAEKTVDVERAKALGREFLESRGIKNMVDTYYIKEDNTATINYAYKQDNVTVYPDLIKLKIALDNGEIIGYEAKGYLSAHVERDIPEPKLSEEEARARVNPRLNILSSGMAIIPTNYKTELFAYEFKGRFNDKDFLVYINAENGKEEDILIIINTEDGILTM
ncbi:MAG: germination protein YpeB [Acetivibrionales bacterium]